MSNKDFEVIIKNTDMNDPDELRDVLTMLGKQVDADQRQIKDLKAALKRINEAVPSTAKRS